MLESIRESHGDLGLPNPSQSALKTRGGYHRNGPKDILPVQYSDPKTGVPRARGVQTDDLARKADGGPSGGGVPARLCCRGATDADVFSAGCRLRTGIFKRLAIRRRDSRYGSQSIGLTWVVGCAFFTGWMERG